MTRDAASLQTQGKRLRTLATAVLAVLILLLVAPYVAAATRALLAAPEPAIGRGAEAGRMMALGLLQSLAAAFYLWGLWSVRQVFGALAGGALFGPAVARGVGRLGWALAGGAVSSIAFNPNLWRWAHDVGLLHGSRRPYSGLLHFDVAYVAIGVVGLALVLLGRLIARAAEVEAHAGALEAELSEFL